MRNNFIVDNQEKIIFDNVNVTETNPLKDLGQILVKIVLIVIFLYCLIYVSAEIVFLNLPKEKQIAFENAITKAYVAKLITIDDKRLIDAKELILRNDSNYHPQNKSEIKIVNSNIYNAFCLPNGNIYVTSALYKHLDNDEKLVFIVAHEIAHYKNKDHMAAIKRQIAGASVVILASLVGQDRDLSKAISSCIELSSLKYSRTAEHNADLYAAQMLKKIYGSTKGGVEVLRFLDTTVSSDAKPKNASRNDILSTHPQTQKRIEFLEKF